MKLWEHYQSRFQVHVDTSKLDLPPDLRFCIVIPAYNEPMLEELLLLLANIPQPVEHYAVIVVLNHPENAHDAVRILHANQLVLLKALSPKLPYSLIMIEAFDIRSAKSGVGFARKLGMDAAAFMLLKRNCPKGLIICLDADCQVNENYLKGIARANALAPNSVSMAFAHPFEKLDDFHRLGIVNYELFLRYYLLALQFTGFPYCAYTIGSAMGTSAQLYLKVGGMNQRKAGEDFYFMNKLLPHENHVFIKESQVFPSPRVSERVPFGTGRRMKMWLEKGTDPALTYSIWSFRQIKSLIEFFEVNNFQPKHFPKNQLPDELFQFLSSTGSEDVLTQLSCKAKDVITRKKRFFQWFDAFLVMKCLNLLFKLPEGQAHVAEGLKALLPDYPLHAHNQPEKILYWLREKEKGIG